MSGLSLISVEKSLVKEMELLPEWYERISAALTSPIESRNAYM